MLAAALLSVAPIAAPIVAQGLAPGSPAPPLDLRAWVHGEPVRLGPSTSGRIVVLEFRDPSNQTRWARASAMTALRHRFREEVVMAGIADDRVEIERAAGELGPSLGYSFAEDHNGATAKAYGVERRPVYFVIESGVIAWVGYTTHELGDVLTDITAGTHDRELAAARARFRDPIALALRHKSWQGLLRIAADLQKLRPHHAYPRTLLVQAYHTAKGDEALARREVERAIEALADCPEQLGAFVYDALMPAGAFGESFREALLDPLGDTAVPRPLRRKLLAAQFWLFAPDRPADAAGRAALWLECVKGDADRCLHFAREVIRLSPDPSLHHLALHALDLGLRADPYRRELHLERFDLLAHKLHDRAGATEVGKIMVEKIGHDPTWLNSFSWRLLTQPETKGRFDELALFAAEHMTQLPQWETYHRLDTVALAKFENGLVDEAITLQSKALEECAPSAKGRYRARLERYRAAKQ